MKRTALFLTFLTGTLGLHDLAMGQAWKADVGLDQLRAENPALTEGVGIKAHLVEPGTNYAPNTAAAQFVDTTINILGPNSTASVHATNSANLFFGANGVARDLGTVGNPAVDVYSASNLASPNTDWINGLINNFNSSLTAARDPQIGLFDSSTVSSHSYILTSPVADNLLQRLDFVINQTDMTTVTGSSNNPSSLPPGWAPAYNNITVGQSGGGAGQGLTTSNGSGRVAVDVVVPLGTSSSATPVVAGGVAILQDAANGGEASRSEVIRATVLAGATKDEADFTTSWSRTTTQPLDAALGAGEFNIYNSYNIQQGGQVDGSSADPTTAAGVEGWDYEASLATNDAQFYEFVVAAGEELKDFSVALAWNNNIIDNSGSPNVFTPSEELANLSLELFNSTGSFLGSLEDASLSSVDNVEHIYVADGLTEGTYHLRVSNDNAFATDYGLAWRGTIAPVVVAVPEPAGMAVLMLGFLCASSRRRR